MDSNLHNELRKEFQLERLILFSDAVFAIAITLLIIEIKIPEVHEGELTDKALVHELWLLSRKFIGFLISFFIIGQYWMVHHRMFGFVIAFNSKLVWMNLLFLLAIVLMPFSTAFYSEYSGAPVVTPSVFYTFNLAFLGAMNFLMWRYLGSPKNNRLTENLSPALARYSCYRALTVPFIFLICALVYTRSPKIAAFIPATIPIVLKLVFAPMKRKLLANAKP